MMCESLYELIWFGAVILSTCILWIGCGGGKGDAKPEEAAAGVEGEKKEDGTPGEEKKDEEKKDEEKKEEGEGEKKEGEEKKEDENKKPTMSKSPDNEKGGTAEKDGKAAISVSPTDLRFETAKTSQQKLRLKNLTDKKLMFKIKATTTNVYLINPVFGKLEPSSFADIIITHRPSAKRDDKLVIVTADFSGKETEIAKTFKTAKLNPGELTVKLVAG